MGISIPGRRNSKCKRHEAGCSFLFNAKKKDYYCWTVVNSVVENEARVWLLFLIAWEAVCILCMPFWLLCEVGKSRSRHTLGCYCRCLRVEMMGTGVYSDGDVRSGYINFGIVVDSTC